MNSASDQERNSDLDAYLRRRLADEVREPSIPEHVLWAYALDVLEPEERQGVLGRIAASESAQAALAQIRATMESRAGLLERARAWAADQLRQMNRDISFVAAVIAQSKDGLLTAFLNVTRPAVPRPVLIGGERKSDAASAESPMPRIDLASSEGITVSLVHVPGQGVELYVEVAEPPSEGHVKLFRFVAAEGGTRQEDTGHQARLHAGRARLPCPEGVLRIVAPGDRAMIICVPPRWPEFS